VALRLWLSIWTVVLLAGAPAGAAAQGPGPVRWPRPDLTVSAWPTGPSTSSLQPAIALQPPPARLLPARDSTRIPHTHWKTGALIGGTTLGLLTAWMFAGLCGGEGPCHQPVLSAVGGFALGGMTGFGLGALIGGQFPARGP
jgi:hypothetical protein